MADVDGAYRELGLRLLDAPRYEGRNSGMRGLVGATLRVDLRRGFPIITSKRVNWKAAFYEMCWFLSGEYGTEELDKYTSIWKPWADRKYIAYGREWRRATVGQGWDQLRVAIDHLKANSGTRRAVVTAWGRPAACQMAELPPCHFTHQYLVRDGVLNLIVYQRSWDFAVGAPFNIAQYALLCRLVARELGIGVGELVFQVGDCHLYESHVPEFLEQMYYWDTVHPNCTLWLDESIRTIDDCTYEAVESGRVRVDGYECGPKREYEIFV